MPNDYQALEEFLDEATLLIQAPEFLDFEEWDLEQDLRHEVILCESTASILARMRLASLPAFQPHTQRVAARQDEVQPWHL